MKVKFKKLWITLGILQIFLTFYLCLKPTPSVQPNIEHLDKLFHFLAYASLAIYQLFFWRNPHQFKIIITLFCQGVLIEILQFFTGYRSFELLDMLANGVGITYGYFFIKGLDL